LINDSEQDPLLKMPAVVFTAM